MKAPWFAWSFCALTIALAAARLSLAIIDPASSDASSADHVPGGGVPVATFESVVLIALAVIGAVVASRQPRNAVGWILCLVPVSLGLLILSAHAYWAVALGDRVPSRGAEILAWMASWVWIPAMIPTLTLFPLLFPTGKPLTRRWRPVEWMAIVTAIVVFVGEAFRPGRFQDYPVDNPFGAPSGVGKVAIAGFMLMAATSIASLTSLVVRFRLSHGDERQQLKWVTTAAVLFVVIFVVPTENFAGEDVGFATLLFGILIVFSGVAVAMLRYRLYDIDVVINRALVYGALTTMLAGTYLGSVLLLQLALDAFTAGSGLAVAASTLATAALFRPLRSRTQAAVDRRFYRRRYDAAQTLERFGSRLRDEVDLDTVTADLREVVANTMQPAHVSLWVRTPESAR